MVEVGGIELGESKIHTPLKLIQKFMQKRVKIIQFVSIHLIEG